MTMAEFDVEIRYAVDGPGGERYTCCKTMAAAEETARSKAGASNYARYGWRVYPRILPTVTVIGGVGPFYLAMQGMGQGVRWFDNHAKFDIKVPYVEVYL